MSKFVLKDTLGNKFMFNLKASNGQVILTSEEYASKQGAEGGIASVRVNSQYDERYMRRTSIAQEPYFTLHASNGQVIGVSEMYGTTQAMEGGITSVKTNAPTASIEDLTFSTKGLVGAS